MTKKFCDRIGCGVETTHSQFQIFDPYLYAGNSIVGDGKQSFGKPKLYDVCEKCALKAREQFAKFMRGGK